MARKRDQPSLFDEAVGAVETEANVPSPARSDSARARSLGDTAASEPAVKPSAAAGQPVRAARPPAPGANMPAATADARSAPSASDVGATSTPLQATVPSLPDAEARAYATDPRRNVVLEASAGTGKTSVLVARYLNLLSLGVDPSNILAITFTRKAAAEMRERIVTALRRAASESAEGRARWLALRDRLNDVAISTIDAFCYGLLREFPLEAGLDPGFTLADETEVARLVEEALDHAIRVCQAKARRDPDVALVFARLTSPRLRAGLAHLLERRLVAQAALARYLQRGPRDLTIEVAAARAADRMRDTLRGGLSNVEAFLADGPVLHPRFRLLAADLRALDRGDVLRAADLRAVDRGEVELEHDDIPQRDVPQEDVTDPARLAAVFDEIRAYFLTRTGEPRTRMTGFTADHASSRAAWKRHVDAVKAVAPAVRQALEAWGRDLNVVLARGVQRMFAIALTEYRRTLAEHEVLDFADVLGRAVDLLRQMDEFSQSRYRLESRYHHVLVDEFQDTSRMQWELVSLLVASWGEGFGLVHEAPLPPSLFIVGDRKQSIYRFRDADVSLLDDAADVIAGLRPEGPVRRVITRSFRSVPALLAFVNDLCGALPEASPRRDAFRYDERDRFPLDGLSDPFADAAALRGDAGPADAAASEATAPVEAAQGDAGSRLRPFPLGVVGGDTIEACAASVAEEIARLLAVGVARDRDTGVTREARPGDIAILFRSRDSHREFERALEARGIPSYVYKGLGFFDADEIKDLSALMRYLAAPESNLRAAAFMRSRFVRLSDVALRELGPDLAAALRPDASRDAGGGTSAQAGAGGTGASEVRGPAIAPVTPPATGVSEAGGGSEPPGVSGAAGVSQSAADARLSEAASASEAAGAFESAVDARLSEEDRRVLARVRASLPTWLALVDRLPPAELIDHVLATSAYGLEVGGVRGHQARENVKKMRGLVRRIQNRGYATLGRIAEHLDRLSAGDEANATIEAVDAVSLMTVHASKGLEFPIVFVVNIARGVAARRQPIRVLVDAQEDDTAVAVESFISEADTLEPAKEREETKRLLYVALTRARDSLYLSTLLKEGQFKPTPGSLGSVLPPTMGALFESASRAAAGTTVRWTMAGNAHEFVVVSPSKVAEESLSPPQPPSPPLEGRDEQRGRGGSKTRLPLPNAAEGERDAEARLSLTSAAEGERDAEARLSLTSAAEGERDGETPLPFANAAEGAREGGTPLSFANAAEVEPDGGPRHPLASGREGGGDRETPLPFANAAEGERDGGPRRPLASGEEGEREGRATPATPAEDGDTGRIGSAASAGELPIAVASDGGQAWEGREGAWQRVRVTGSGGAASGRGSGTGAERAGQAIVGRLVHRLFQSRAAADASIDALARQAQRLMRAEESIGLDRPEDVARQAAAIFQRVAGRKEVRELLAGGAVLYEVPFSMRRPHGDHLIVRGTIDAVVQQPDGTVVVIEFKTGGAHVDHDEQLALYVEAARAVFPDKPVTGRLIYP